MKFVTKKNIKAIPIKVIKTHTILLSLPKPNGIKPIKPPTATFVSLFWVLVIAPMKTKAKPIRIIKIPRVVRFGFILYFIVFLII